jgi:uncharacterized membrane-anchored protein YjiN (DUF445 family)
MNSTEAALARRLARMRWIATGLLLLMAALFVTTRVWLPQQPWLGAVMAFAEAGMIGALADWFAVTALFRHPLGLPIPHTAIVPSRKNEIGHALAQFIRDNFLVRGAVTSRLADIDLAQRLGSWLGNRENTKRVSRDVALAIAWLVEAIDSARLGAAIQARLRVSLDSLPLRAGLSAVLEVLSTGPHAQALVDHLVAIGQQLLTDNRELIRVRIHDRSPWWLPKFVDEEIYDQLVTELKRLLDDIAADPDHPARMEFNRRLEELNDLLGDDSKLADRTRRLKQEFIDHPAVRAYLEELWLHVRDQIRASLEDPGSSLRAGLERELRAAGTRLQDDRVGRERLDRWLKDLIVYLIENYRQPLSETISETIEQWDPTATSRRIELYIGRDLQFIRISGTLVGGSAGVVIFFAAEWLGL